MRDGWQLPGTTGAGSDAGPQATGDAGEYEEAHTDLGIAGRQVLALLAAASGSTTKIRALAAAAAVMVAGGCSSVPTASHPHAAGGGVPGYWTRSRLLGARVVQGLGYQPGKPANAHPVRCLPGSAGCLPVGLAARVVALFFHDAGGHYCTASVVASPGRDLLITAAHCINSGKGGGYRQSIVFIPDYRDGQAPFGIWTPARMLVAPQWIRSSDPDLDVGFVVLNSRDGENIQQVLSANRLGIDSGYRYLVRVTGYPGSGGAPVTCVNPSGSSRGCGPAAGTYAMRPSCSASCCAQPCSWSRPARCGHCCPSLPPNGSDWVQAGTACCSVPSE